MGRNTAQVRKLDILRSYYLRGETLLKIAERLGIPPAHAVGTVMIWRTTLHARHEQGERVDTLARIYGFPVEVVSTIIEREHIRQTAHRVYWQKVKEEQMAWREDFGIRHYSLVADEIYQQHRDGVPVPEIAHRTGMDVESVMGLIETQLALTIPALDV